MKSHTLMKPHVGMCSPSALCAGQWPGQTPVLSAFLTMKEEDIPFQFLQLLRSPSEIVIKDLPGQNVLHLQSFYVICL